MSESQNSSEKFDWTLCLILLLLFLVSCAAIYSAQKTGQYVENFLLKQIFWYFVGAVIVFIVMHFDTDQYKRLSWYLYGFGLFILFLLLISPESLAPVRNGAKSWFIIPGLGSIQPSEFVKTFLILALSKVIFDHNNKYLNRTLETDWLLFFKMAATTAAPLGFIMLQPDLGTSLVLIAIFSGILFVSGISWKIITLIYGTGGLLAGGVMFFVIWAPDILEKYLKVKPYQFERIYSWLDPVNHQSTSGYHLDKSLKAIGSGQILGKGFGERIVYIPESHTDFIFSVIGEEYGFVGGSIVIGLFFILIYHLTRTALDSKEPFNAYICAGVISMITFHVFQNIGMCIQLLPITGIPLPFISYGGSSLLGNMLAMGLIFGIRYHYKSYLFSNASKYFPE